jgi:energy-coupling factor transporter ATP-binding protein EcfA2
MKTFIDIESGGFKPGEVIVMMARQTGKSTFTQMFNQVFPPEKFTRVSLADVDGEMWYTIRTSDPEVSKWIRSQDRKLKVETTANYPNYFDVHEKLYVMLVLRFQ